LDLVLHLRCEQINDVNTGPKSRKRLALCLKAPKYAALAARNRRLARHPDKRMMRGSGWSGVPGERDSFSILIKKRMLLQQWLLVTVVDGL
jgi:hypothetical protein